MMSKLDQSDSRDYSKFDNLSTEELEAILRLDAQLEEAEGSDLDTVLYISEVLAQREKKYPTGKYPDMQIAWLSFNQNYRPFVDDSLPLYPEDDTEQAELVGSSVNSQKKHTRFRVAIVVAAVIAILLVGTITASAFGLDVLGIVARWTKGSFHFSTSDNTQQSVFPSEEKIPEQLAQMEAAMHEYQFPQNLLPHYLPSGYKVTEFECDVSSDSVDIYCFLSNGEKSIILNYCKLLSGEPHTEYQKDINAPKLHVVDNVVYYILTNYGDPYTTWIVNDVECYIFASGSEEELLEIIDSISGE